MVKHHLWKVIVAVVLAAALVTPGVSATSLVFQSPPPVSPPNDNFADAVVIPALPFSETVDLLGATAESGEPNCHFAYPLAATAWYKFTASTDEQLEASMSGGGYGSVFAVYEAVGSGLAGLSSVKCTSDNSSISFAFDAVAGRTYYLQVGYTYYGDYLRYMTVGLKQVLPPVNDNFADATIISGTPYSDVIDITGATTEPNEPQGCNFGVSRTVWYSFTPSSNGRLSADFWDQYPFYDGILTAYRSDGSGIGGLTSLGCAWQGGSVAFDVQAGIVYYFQVGSISLNYGVIHLNMAFYPAPANDDFANALAIGAALLPYNDSETIAYATTQPGEQQPSCAGSMYKTVWYAYTPVNSGSFMASTLQPSFEGFLAVWTGSELGNLTEVRCHSFYYNDTGRLAFHAEAGTTYHIQVGSLWGGGDQMNFQFEVTPPPQAQFGFYPGDPSVFDNIQFYDNSWDPAELGIQSQAWAFGDGTTAEGCCPTHRYANDGDYTVTLAVTTPDGRTASTSQTVHVKTHDVAITKFSAPQSASAGQTRQIVVGLNSKRYVEDVEVTLYKSVPNGYQYVGTLKQTVPVRPSNRTTDFSFSYTFTKDDATIGKVTFKAVATILNARDALPADNESVASPTKVGKK